MRESKPYRSEGKYLILILWMIAMGGRGMGQLLVSEFQALNTTTIMDPDFQSYSDWLELFNASGSDLDISDYWLTDDLLQPGKWKIPAGQVIPAGGYLLIWADGRDTGLHAGFKLSGQGEAIGMFSPGGEIIDTVVYSSQRSDISTGRVSSSGRWVVFTHPTPGASNPDSGFDGISGEPLFSIKGGFYSHPVDLLLVPPSAGGEVRYTMDGSEPDTASPLWENNLLLSATTIIRARVFEDQRIPGNTVTHTYFISEPGHDLPVVSISTDPDHLWDPQTGIYVNYTEDWERPCGFELFSPSGEREIGLNAGLKIFGGTSRSSAQKSFSIHARGRYGEELIRYPLLPGRETDQYGSFILRNGGNDWSGEWRGTMFRDELIHTVVENQMDLDYQSYNPVAVYLNGEYWGILNIRDKHNEDYCEILYGADPDNVDIIKHNEVESGNKERYNEMMEFLENHDLFSGEEYQEAAAMIDTEELINYLITEIYSCNIDWPANNHRLWSPRTAEGKWRWMLFDTEFGFNGFQWAPVTTNMFAKVLDPDIDDYVNKDLKAPWATRVFIKMTQNEEFRNEFISRYLSHVYTTYDPQRVIGIVDSLSGRLESEMPRHIARWGSEGGIYNMDVWRQNVQGMKDFAIGRPPYAVAHLMQTFHIQESDRVSLELACDAGATLILNGIPLEEPAFSADFFLGNPITLDLNLHPGYLFKGWTLIDSATQVRVDTLSLELILDGDLKIVARMEKQDGDISLVFNEIVVSNTSGAVDEFGEEEDWIELYNPGEEAVDVGGLFLTDSLAEPERWEIPRGYPGSTTAEGKGFILLWADGEPGQGPLHLGFRLSREGEEIGLYQRIGEEMVLVDSVSFPSLGADVSLARVPDGIGAWMNFGEPTPGTFNFFSGVKSRRVTEGTLPIFPNPTDGPVRIPIPSEPVPAGRTIPQLTLFSITGQVILQRSCLAGEEIVLDLSSLEPGLYLVRLFTGTRSLTEQILLLK